MIVQRGPAYGYYVNPSKTYLVIRQNGYEEAVKVFEDTGVHITQIGKDTLDRDRQLGRLPSRKSMLKSRWMNGKRNFRIWLK